MGETWMQRRGGHRRIARWIGAAAGLALIVACGSAGGPDARPIEGGAPAAPVAVPTAESSPAATVGRAADPTAQAADPTGVAAQEGDRTGEATQAAQVIELRSLALRPGSPGVRLEVGASAPVAWTSYRRSPATLIVELTGVVPVPGLVAPASDGGLLRSVEVEEEAGGLRPLTRLEIESREDVEFAITANSTGLVVDLVPAGTPERAAQPPATAAAAEPLVTELAADRAPVVAPEPAPALPTRMAVGWSPSAQAPPAAGTADDPTEGPPVSGVRATQLQGVEIAAEDGTTVITVRGDGEFEYSTFVLADPERFVVDLPGVVNTAATPAAPAGGSVVDGVRMAQFRPAPEPIARVVVDLREHAVPAIERSADGLTLRFGAGEPAAEVAAAPEAEAVAGGSDAEAAAAEVDILAAAAQEDSAAEADAAAEAPETAAVAAPSAGDLEAAVERSLGTSAEPAADEPVAGEETTPSDLPTETEVESWFDENADAGGNAWSAEEPVADVRPGAEAAGEAGMDLESPASLMAPQEMAQEPMTQEPMTEEELDTPSQAPPVPSADPAPPAPAPTTDIALLSAAQADAPVVGAGDQALQRFETRSLGATERVYRGEPMTLSLKDADIKDVLRSFAQISGLNIVVQPGVTGTVTVELKQVPWDQALEQILKINGLGYELEGNILRIAPTGKLREEAEEAQALRAAQALSVPLRTVIQRVSYADANALAGILKASVLSQRGSVIVDLRTNTLIVKELPDYMNTVIALIENLDIPEPQVMIEARIVETTKRFTRTLGIAWGFEGIADAAHGNTTGLQFPNNVAGDGSVNLLTGGSNGLLNISMGNVLNTFNLDVTLQAAETQGLINILSAPKVATLNNEQASIQSGLQIPIQTVANNTVSVQFVNATLRLDVTPHVTAEGTVLMDINIQKREPQIAFALPGAQNAPIATKEARTRVIVRDGGTTVIGGIYEVSSDEGIDGVPGLANVPVLGHLFKNKRRVDENEELLIFITPRVLKL